MQGGSLLHPGIRRAGISIAGAESDGRLNGSALVVQKNEIDTSVVWFWHTAPIRSIASGKHYLLLVRGALDPPQLALRPGGASETVEAISTRVREHDQGDGRSLTGSFATFYGMYGLHRYVGLPLDKPGTDNCPTSVVIEAREEGYIVSGMPNRRCTGEVEGVRDVLVLRRAGRVELGEYGTGSIVRQSTHFAQFQPARGCLDVR